MKRQTFSVLLIAFVCLSGTALLGQEQQRRQSVTLPADAKAIFLAQMLGHVVSLDGIVTALGQGLARSVPGMRSCARPLLAD